MKRSGKGPARGKVGRLERFREIHASLEQIGEAWFQFETSTEDVFLKRPLLNDIHEPLVRAFRQRWADASEFAQNWPGEGPTPTDQKLQSFEQLVKQTSDAWHRADEHAIEVGLDNFRPNERSALRRAAAIVALMNDGSTTR